MAPPGYKHGPFGSRGLGQLAYDKGLQVLAASQSEQVALEIRDLKHGLLTYALLQDGLAKRGAAMADGAITLQSWLSFAERRVESLYTEVLEGRVAGRMARSHRIPESTSCPAVGRPIAM